MNSILSDKFSQHIVYICLFGFFYVIILNFDKDEIYSVSIAYLILSVLILIISFCYMMLVYYNIKELNITITIKLLLASILSIVSIVFSILTLEYIKNKNKNKNYIYDINQIIFFVIIVILTYP